MIEVICRQHEMIIHKHLHTLDVIFKSSKSGNAV